MARILVIGDRGLLGQALVQHAQALRLSVRGASRQSRDLTLDATDGPALAQLLDRVAPTLVINAAGLIDVNRCEAQPQEAEKYNTQMPGQIAAACAQRGIVFVQVSTDHYYTGDGRTAHHETSPVTLLNAYARSKYAGETLVLSHPQTLVLRTNIVGFRGWPGAPTFVEWLLGELEAQRPITLYDDFYTSSIAVAQFVPALLDLTQAGARGIFNLASGEGSSKREFALALAAACGLYSTSCRAGSVRDIAGVPRAESLVLDVSKAQALLAQPLPDLSAVVECLAKEYRLRKSRQS